MAVLNFNTEQQQFIDSVDAYASQFADTEDGEAQMLQYCYEQMMPFKSVINSCSKQQLDYIYHQYKGFYRFAKLMERLASGIYDGTISV